MESWRWGRMGREKGENEREKRIWRDRKRVATALKTLLSSDRGKQKIWGQENIVLQLLFSFEVVTSTENARSSSR